MSPEDPKPQPATTEQGAGHYLFLSYARPDSAVADRVEACLTAAGVRVFRDLHDIRPGENWDRKIEIALDECPRMVLLLSPSSMPYRKEVHREWFYFDQLNKPIYPLFIADCHLNSRMMAYNYIDAREDLPGAVDRIVADLDLDFKPPLPMSDADKISVFEKGDFDERDVEKALRDMEQAVLEPQGGVVLSQDQAIAVRDHKPVDLKQYRLGRIAEWSLPRHQINKRFVNLTLILDKGENEPQRWQREDYRFSDLRDVLEKTKEDPALVLLGAPGSGKSTLLRRLQLDHSIERLHDGGPQVSFFIQLNTFKGDQVEPAKWLCERWKESYPQLPTLESYLLNGRVLLLLDALNEMPHKSPDDYRRLVGQWRDFAQEVCRKGNRIVFSCRSLDYSASLSSKEMRVPQVEIQPMNADQVLDFLRAYLPGRHERVWAEIDGEKESGFYRTPYFLKLLCEQVVSTGEVPKGRAGHHRLVVDDDVEAVFHEGGLQLLGRRAVFVVVGDKDFLGGQWASALPSRNGLNQKRSRLAGIRPDRRGRQEYKLTAGERQSWRSLWSAAARDLRRKRISPVVETKLAVTKGNPDSPRGLADAALVCLAPYAR